MGSLDDPSCDADNHLGDREDGFSRHLDEPTACETISRVDGTSREKPALCGSISGTLPKAPPPGRRDACPPRSPAPRVRPRGKDNPGRGDARSSDFRHAREAGQRRALPSPPRGRPMSVSRKLEGVVLHREGGTAENS